MSLSLIFLVLYSRYRSTLLALIIMGNIPLALVGSVVALWISGQPLSVAALVAAFALLPLLLSADAPGKEILHPVAVVIFGGLISSTLLDTVLTPVMFWLFGEKALNRLLLAQLQTQSRENF